MKNRKSVLMGSHRAGCGEFRVGLTHDYPPAVNR